MLQILYFSTPCPLISNLMKGREKKKRVRVEKRGQPERYGPPPSFHLNLPTYPFIHATGKEEEERGKRDKGHTNQAIIRLRSPHCHLCFATVLTVLRRKRGGGGRGGKPAHMSPRMTQEGKKGKRRGGENEPNQCQAG